MAGATGSLGREVVARLAGRGLRVRALARDPDAARRSFPTSVEIAVGDVREPDSVAAAVTGVASVVSALTGFARGGGPAAVDHQGNRNLMIAAERAGVERFVLTSIVGASLDHPLELYRMKALAERDLRKMRLRWTVVRPTVLMETWVGLAGDAIASGRPVPVVGRGENPVNFVSAIDVAKVIEMAVAEPGLDGEAVDVAGPENLTLMDVIRIFELATGQRARIRRLPLPAARALSMLLRPVLPTPARVLKTAIAMETTDMTFDTGSLRRRFPLLEPVTFAERARRREPAPPVAPPGPR